MAVSWASENGIANGINDYYFGATQNITREQLAVMLYNYAVYEGIEDREEISDTCLDVYTDAGEVSSWAEAAMKWAVTNGIIGGTTATTLSPSGNVNRLQLATLVLRMRDELVENGVITTVPVSSSVNHSADAVGYIDSVLDENSWLQINAASEAGIADVIWNVGDTKTVTLSTGESITMQIYGFNHDDLTDGGKAGITFGLTKVMDEPWRMNYTAEDGIGFTDTFLYGNLDASIYGTLPAELRYVMKSVEKKTSVGDGSTDIETESMRMFLFSEVECFGGTAYSVPGEGSQYAIFAADLTYRGTIDNGHILEWWLRSPKSTGSSSFCIVHSSGNAGHTSATWPYAGVNFGLCI